MFKELQYNLYNDMLNINKDIEIVKELVAKFYNIPKEALDRVKLKFKSLPIIFYKAGDYIKYVVKKIGLYYPDKKEINIEKNLPYYEKIKALIHEYVHAAQDYLGKIGRLSKKKIEEEAYIVTNYLSRIYKQVYL
jgi:Zn-dependent peptidase ImmA (M78 family)